MRRLKGNRLTELRRYLGAFVMLAVLSFAFVACNNGVDSGSDKYRQQAVAARENNFAKGEAMWPAPTDLHNYPMRQALVQFTERQDLVNHPWYIYLLGQNGGIFGYYIGKTYPQSNCNYLSSTERFVDLPDGAWGNAVAPSYDAVFYGGGGSSAACTSMFFFDNATDAMITFDVAFTASDAPLDIQAQYLGPKTVPKDSTPSTPTAPTPTATAAPTATKGAGL